MSLGPDAHVLDVGCGIGGAARFMAGETGCRVTGIDLTPEYISTVKILSTLTGLDHRVNFKIDNALNMPFEKGSFDAA
ncbi:MAG: methyltransferase domain-containing protein, partial [Rhodospirillales bacterium]